MYRLAALGLITLVTVVGFGYAQDRGENLPFIVEPTEEQVYRQRAGEVWQNPKFMADQFQSRPWDVLKLLDGLLDETTAIAIENSLMDADKARRVEEMEKAVNDAVAAPDGMKWEARTDDGEIITLRPVEKAERLP